MTANDPLELVGTTIADKYLVETVVGEGGFAVVYRAVHQIWNRPVALKVFKALDEVPEAMRDKLLKEFVQEGALLAELSEKSAAIVQARDVGMLTTKKGASIPYMVLEWLEGHSLEAILERERSQGAAPRSLGQAMILLQPVAQALGLAHERGIAHRDVKPANVFVIGDPYVAQPSVKLLDFGIAKVVQDAQKMGGSFTKTSGQITSFTPAYGAPEQFSRDYGSTGPWTDVFALTLMLVELITGREPLGGDTLTMLAFASVDSNKRPTPRSMGAEISDEVEAVFARALAVRPENRFRTAGELWSAMEAAARGEAATFATSSTMMVAPASAGAYVPPASGGNRPTNTTSRGVATDPTPAEAAPAGGGKGGLLAGVALVALIGVGGAVYALRGGASAGGGGASTASANASPSTIVAASASAAAPKTTCPAGMKYIPGGNTFIGSEPGDGVPPAETPRFPVTLSPYCMDVHEVTAGKYAECAKSAGCARIDGDLARNDWDNITSMARKVYDPLCTMRVAGEKTDYPANCITWTDAAEYCKLRKGSLPTEAQWEFAARGTSQLKFPWGDDEHLEGRLNACGTECLAWGMKNDPKNFGQKMYGFDDHFETLSPVGQFRAGASQFGIEDLSGNVFEWVQDAWGPYKTAERVTDPQGPAFRETTESGDRGERVVRGGAWNSVDLVWLRPTFRWHRPPHYRTHGIGFRCVAAPGT